VVKLGTLMDGVQAKANMANMEANSIDSVQGCESQDCDCAERSSRVIIMGVANLSIIGAGLLISLIATIGLVDH
jgi:hypothetical protein